MVKPYVDSDNSSEKEREDEVEEEEDSETYEVEAIVAQRGSENKKEFKVRWKGYDPSFDTWEPLANLDGAQEKVQEYLKGVSAKKNRRRSTASQHSSTPTRRHHVGSTPFKSELGNSRIEKYDKPDSSSVASSTARDTHINTNHTTTNQSKRRIPVESDEEQQDIEKSLLPLESSDEYPGGKNISRYQREKNWEHLVQHVITVEDIGSGRLKYFVKWHDGEEGWVDDLIFEKKTSQKALAFFKNNLKFYG